MQTFVKFLEKIHKVHFIQRNPHKDTCGPGEIDKIQTTTRSDYACPEVGRKLV